MLLSWIKSSDERRIVETTLTEKKYLFFDFYSRSLYISAELITLILTNASTIEFFHLRVTKTKTYSLCFCTNLVSLLEETLKNFNIKLARIAKQSR